MINYETIKSSFDDKLTLLQWLKKVEAALSASVLVSVEVLQPTETTAILTFDFEDGTSISSPSITLPRGASVVNATLDQNNNLILVLDNGRSINVGNIMPENINAQNGTFSVSLATPNANISVATIGNLNVVTNIESESASFAGTIDAGGYYTEGNAEVEGNVEVDGNMEVGGNVSVTGSVTAASFNGENARPLYMHEMSMFLAADFYVSFTIINNRSEPLTLADIKTELENRSISETGRINCSCLYSQNGVSCLGYWLYATTSVPSRTYGIAGSRISDLSSSNKSSADFYSVFPTTTQVRDYVHKVNG